MTARYRKSGFTLVEILIVVVILGILAAIVIPQFSSASESAQASSLKSTLQTLRSQLELFQVQHNGHYPPGMVDGSDGLPEWDAMLNKHGWDEAASLTDGLQLDDLDESKTDFGPYMQKFPANPFAAGSSTATDHWFYNPTTGKIAANVSHITQSKREGLGLEADDEDYAIANPFGASEE